MAETSIEWTRGPRGELGYTFNPWIGCTKISPGCDHCYAARQDAFRSWTPEGWGGARRRTSEANWKLPERWNKAAAAAGERRRVFCSSLADVFDNQVPVSWRADLLALIAETPNLDWLLLTKRIGIADRLIHEALVELGNGTGAVVGSWPWPNVWIGATVVNQEEADRDIPKLLDTPARVRFLSMEPLLGDVDLTPHLWGRPKPCDDCPKDADCDCGYARRGSIFKTDGKLDWVIVGGESGPGARPMHPDWARSLRDQCAAADVPFLFKQHGEWRAIDQGEGDWYSHLYRPNRVAREGEDQAALIECWGQRCTVPQMILHRDGEHRQLGDSMAFAAGKGAMQAFKVGKKAAGRLLDGVTHDGFPEAR
jgi:protein gp37